VFAQSKYTFYEEIYKGQEPQFKELERQDSLRATEREF